MQLDRKSLPLTSVSLASLPKFCSTLTTIPKVSKTGLGSSAAMITSLTAAILSYFDVINLSSRDNRDLALVHNVAQFAHCLAQGKIGSGFDVSAAVYGSHSYRRPLEESALTAKDIVAKLDPASATNWDCEVEQFKLPPGFKLMLADIDAGSNTPKLVSQVLKWRQDSPEEGTIMVNSTPKNKKCQEVFQALNTASQDYPEEYWNALANINNLELSTGSVSEHLNHLKNTFAQIRHLLRDMSTKANTPVEPIEQTTLLDACTAIPGVIMAGVPGAGGYDAIFVIYIDHNNVSPRSQIEQVWSGWTRMLVGPLLAGEDFVGITVEPDFSYTA
ncbi:hypothetical protein BC829DRAFT_378842 [Chytridium lagenaria]|nr:hypothetical protein BC829DRAFT_378842 [Chytridium lagenaria]